MYYLFTLKTLQPRRLFQGLVKQRVIEFGCDISTGQYQSSSGLLRYHEFTEIYMKLNNDRKLHNMTWYGVASLKRQDNKKMKDIIYIVTVHHVY